MNSLSSEKFRKRAQAKLIKDNLRTADFSLRIERLVNSPYESAEVVDDS